MGRCFIYLQRLGVMRKRVGGDHGVNLRDGFEVAALGAGAAYVPMR